ncbi:type II secretion system GspH family protein [Myxococcota bacterium]|nr:type II secretion system GspH family protein [Myxococcota bacterium]
MIVRTRRRGSTLIEAMIATSILSLGAAWLVTSFHEYQRASERTFEAEGLSRVLDVELERFRACGSRACIDALATRTATTAGLSDAANTWVRARVERRVAAGPDGTTLVTVIGHVDGVPEQRVVGLVRAR